MTARVLAFKPRPGRLAYAWYSRSMERVAGGALLYRTPEGRTVRVTLVDEWRGGSRMAKWRDLEYVGRVRLDWCRKMSDAVTDGSPGIGVRSALHRGGDQRTRRRSRPPTSSFKREVGR